MESNLPKIPEIDLTQLEKQFAEHPTLVESHADALADAKKKLAKVEDELEETDAKVKLAIRKDPESYGLDRVTEEGVKTAYVLDERHRKAKERVIRAQYDVDMLAGKMTVLSHRKSALENEVILFSQSYFAAPKAPPEVKDKMHQEERRKEARKGRK